MQQAFLCIFRNASLSFFAAPPQDTHGCCAKIQQNFTPFHLSENLDGQTPEIMLGNSTLQAARAITVLTEPRKQSTPRNELMCKSSLTDAQMDE